VICELCGQAEAVEIPGCPFLYCDQCFAYMGVSRVRRVPKWKHYLRLAWLFVRIVWRYDQTETRMSVSTAYSVCKGLYE
jgi:hypothetical protein